jgi:CheY-like chemotaxis protein
MRDGIAVPDRPAIEILLVEDNPADIRMVREALAVARIPHRLHVVTEGEQAMSFLRGSGPFAGAPRPDLVLLDVRLPGLNGFAVLAVIRGHPRLEKTFVVVLTGSEQGDYRQRSRELDADAFVVKPASLEGYVAELKRIRDLALRA